MFNLIFVITDLNFDLFCKYSNIIPVYFNYYLTEFPLTSNLSQKNCFMKGCIGKVNNTLASMRGINKVVPVSKYVNKYTECCYDSTVLFN